VRRFYDELVNAGGRPLFPITLLDEVSKDPGAYKEMLLPWQDGPDVDPPDWTTVFRNQAHDWQEFLNWQKYNRSEKSPTIRRKSFSAAAYKCFCWHFRRKPTTYTAALKTLLAEYGFTRSFHLQDNPARQNELTTWIEYLGYGCATHYQHSKLVELLQPKHDEAWKTLVDSGVLRPSETRESLDDPTAPHRLDLEAAQARKAVELAKSAVNAALAKPCVAANDSQQAHVPGLVAAQSRLKVASMRLESVEKRNDHIDDFVAAVSGHCSAKTEVRLRYARLRWILEQVPVVEAEKRKATAAAGNTKSQSVRRISSVEEGAQTCQNPDQEQSKDEQASPPTGVNEIFPAQTGGSSKRTRTDDNEHDGRRSKRVRKDLDVGLTETTTPAGRPVTRKVARPHQHASVPPQIATAGPKPKRPSQTLAVSEVTVVALRRSRRLAGDQAEFGLLKERRGQAPVEEPVQRSSGAVPKSQAPPVNAPKTKGTAASKQARTARKKRRAK